MAGEERGRPSRIGPFREAFAPPRVVLYRGVKLRQVKGDETGASIHQFIGVSLGGV